MIYKRYILASLSISIMSLAHSITPLSHLPNQAVIHAILEGNAPGTVLDKRSPNHQYTLLKSTGPFTFLTGNPSKDELSIISADLLLNITDIRLVCDEHLHAFLLKNGFALQPRISLHFPENITMQIPALPFGFTAHLIDNFELLHRCTWYPRVIGWHKTAENFFRTSFGFALINDQGIIVAESYGAFIGKGLCEIGIVSHPDHQGKGYATLIAHYALAECQKRSIKPVWSCNSDNIGSLCVALKLGFQIEKHYAFLVKAPRNSA